MNGTVPPIMLGGLDDTPSEPGRRGPENPLNAFYEDVPRIRQLCEDAGMPELADRYIVEGLSADQVFDELYESLAEANRAGRLGK